MPKAVKWFSLLYLALVLLLWGLLETGGDRNCPGTVLLFSPRWCALLPLALLVPLAARYRRGTLLALSCAAFVVLVPFMGLTPHLSPRSPVPRDFRLLSCNVNDGGFSEERLARLILDEEADVVALQECPDTMRLRLPQDWRMVRERGLAVLSRFPLAKVSSVPVFRPPDRWPVVSLLHCVVAGPRGQVDVCSVELPSPRPGLLNLLDRATLLAPSRCSVLVAETRYRRRASAETERYVATLKRPLVVAGDFNLPVESDIYRGIWSRYRNGFSLTGSGYGFSQRAALKGLPVPVRIDHVLTGNGMDVAGCRVGAEVGSDHLPLVTDLHLE